MQLMNGHAALLRARMPGLYVALRRFRQRATRWPHWAWAAWRKPKLPEDIGAYPIRSTEKLRFTDTDRNGHISNAVFAVCFQNVRMEVLSDPNRAPVPAGAHFVIVRLQLDFLSEMHWLGTVEIGISAALQLC